MVFFHAFVFFFWTARDDMWVRWWGAIRQEDGMCIQARICGREQTMVDYLLSCKSFQRSHWNQNVYWEFVKQPKRTIDFSGLMGVPFGHSSWSRRVDIVVVRRDQARSVDIVALLPAGSWVLFGILLPGLYQWDSNNPIWEPLLQRKKQQCSNNLKTCK